MAVLSQFKRTPACLEKSLSWPPLRPVDPHHKIFYNLVDGSSNSNTKLFWDNQHVYMPHHNRHVYYDPLVGNLRPNWDQITRAWSGRHHRPVQNIWEFEQAIHSYNSHDGGSQSGRWRFHTLRALLDNHPPLAREFFGKLLPRISKLALKLPELCPGSIPILKQNVNMKLTFTQGQIACLLANAFLCTFPTRHRNPVWVPTINFHSLFNGVAEDRKLEKLKCLFNYFRRIVKQRPRGTITYVRQAVVKDFPNWAKLDLQFTKLAATAHGRIEDEGWGMLQVDFANRLVGGGVLGHGLVQEEIRFVICPELIAARLFTEILADHEVLIVIGCERFSTYKGYSDTFTFAGDFIDTTGHDEWGRRYTEVVAMDATVFRQQDDIKAQYHPDKLTRETNKAFCGFIRDQVPIRNLSAICTGNWGCGFFGGDKQLKALLQWIAASAAHRDIYYLTGGDTNLAQHLNQMHHIFTEYGLPISRVWAMILAYYHTKSSSLSNLTLFQYIATQILQEINNE